MEKSYWDNRYLQGETQWDIGAPSPALTHYLDNHAQKNMAILIPGCGHAYEADYLLQQGFENVSLIDISEIAVNHLFQKYASQNHSIQIFCEDFFAHQGQYDLILEQTFFCALLPERRPEYVQKMHALLKPAGRLVGVFYNRDFEGGPPFGGSQKEYEKLFSEKFKKLQLAPCAHSIKPRQGSELFLIAEK